MSVRGFKKTVAGNVTLWAGTPDCQAAHEQILAWLCERYPKYPSKPRTLDNAMKGNLGEAISFVVAKGDAYGGYHAFAANALDPFSGIPRSKIDIVWICFAKNKADDQAVLQEIKATSDASLNYADELLVDAEKLFGPDLRFTLRSRLDDIKYQVIHTLKKPELAPRINALGGKTPKKSFGVKLLPTLVHERNGTDPAKKMLAIRTALLGKGWDSNAIEAWSIAMSDFDARLLRLAQGLK
jgi:hypothetical protein